jgi:hypothetical protein
MPATHPEMAHAWCSFLAELRARKLATPDDVSQENGGARWQYLCSTPYRSDDGEIEYLHIFYHPNHPLTGEVITVGQPASDGWWPDASCQVLPGMKSERRFHLRLVS